VNITNGFIDSSASVWWYFIEEVLATGRPLKVSWEGVDLAWPAMSPAMRNAALDTISNQLRGPGRLADGLLRAIGEAAGIDPCAVTRRLCMNWDELREFAADPLVTIGAHTARHHSLNSLTEEQIVEEVDVARRELAERLGREVRHFAYPFGGPNAVGDREFAIARRFGFTTMLTTRAGNLTRENVSRMECLPRLTISGNYPVLKVLRLAESGLAAWREKRRGRG
jgi:peptidoglycan/xylan/chitin deacetylase (PgdA/CDA1 family)